MCQVCRKPIPKQTKRICFSLLTGSRRYRNGGRTSNQMFFLHTACGRTVFEEFRHMEDTGEKCWDCGAAIPKTDDDSGVGVSRSAVCIGTRSMWGYLCQSCSHAPRYRKCDICRVLFNKYQTSPLVEDPVRWSLQPGEKTIVCDYCAEGDGLITQKALARVERTERRFRERYETIIDGILKGEMFRGASAPSGPGQHN